MEPIPTGKQWFTVDCPWCRGTGRHPQLINGWYIDYHYQDGHETCGPYSKEQVLEYMKDNDRTVIKTLIGPDGCVWTLPK